MAGRRPRWQSGSTDCRRRSVTRSDGHSTLQRGCAPLDAVLFLADFIEENRRSLACVRCREYYEGLWRCGDTDALEKALVFGLDAVIRENLEEGNLILKDTLESRNAILYTLLQKADGQA